MKRTIYTTIAVLVLIASVASAQQQRMQRWQQRAPGVQQQERAIDKLNLTDEQKEQIDELRNEWQKERVLLDADLKLARLELQNLSDDPEATSNQLKSMMEKVSDQQIALRLKQREHMLQVRGLLTPEQQKIWDEARKFRGRRGNALNRGGMRGMRGSGMHRGMGRGMRRPGFRGFGPGNGYDFAPMQGQMRGFRGRWDDEEIIESSVLK